ncbi:MAG: SCP2 domain-containing protein [Gammaproteobacteria bacterium]
MRNAVVASAVPLPVQLLLRPLPFFPLRFALQRMVDHVWRRQPGLSTRLDVHGRKVFLIDPTDLPFVFRFVPHPNRPTVEPRRRCQSGGWDARIAGPLGALIGMVHGALDGDALFFAGDIVVEGDTEAVLALRNALDDAEIDLVSEATAAFGPAGEVIERLARLLLPAASQLTGLTLTRADRR